MYYIAYIGLSLIIIHFILYYFNIDVFNYSSKPTSSKLIDNDITDSINELKKLNEYIDNGICENGKCENGVCENGKCENGIRENGVCENGFGLGENAICKTL